VIDSGYITAFAALGGAALGGLTSFATSWTTLHAQMKAQQNASSKSSRQKLYKSFIEEAAKIYGDALIHETLETTGLIDLHALVSRMRIVSSGPVIECAVNVVKVITETYRQPNMSPDEIEAMISQGTVDILRNFSESCREELEQSLQL
jgi:hypothetical protein